MSEVKIENGTKNPEVSKKLAGPDVSRQIFGGVLDQDAGGFYPGIELFNFIYCSEPGSFNSKSESTSIKRRAHDFARRLVWDEDFYDSDQIKAIIMDPETEEALRSLLRCVQLPIPNIVKQPGWERAHFFPFTSSLIHWDARKRKVVGGEIIKIERRYLRGGGALVFHVLRMDEDVEKLNRIKAGFDSLFDNNASALERLSAFLLEQSKSDTEYVEDEIESTSCTMNDELDEILRSGMLNIVEHFELTPVARVRAVIIWSAFWLTLIQHRRAAEKIGETGSFLTCDCGAEQKQLRRASQRSFRQVEQQIIRAVELLDEDGQLAKRQKSKIKGFFWSTAATIGLLNSWRGRRHFTLGLELLETLVMAAVPRTSELAFEQFVDSWLYDKCMLVVGRKAAEKTGQLDSFDLSVFEDNEEHLAVQMRAAGLLTQYSDATRMVGTGGLK